MALQGPFPVQFGAVFPDGAYAAGWHSRWCGTSTGPTGTGSVQQADKATGLPLWVIEVIDADRRRGSGRSRSRWPRSTSRCCRACARGRRSPGRVRGHDSAPVLGDSAPDGRWRRRCGARQAYSVGHRGACPVAGDGRPAPEHMDAA